MNRRLKLAIVVLCFVLCGAATVVVSLARDEEWRQRTNAMPIENHQIIHRSWIEV